jgi:hypothetical protein
MGKGRGEGRTDVVVILYICERSDVSFSSAMSEQIYTPGGLGSLSWSSIS